MRNKSFIEKKIITKKKKRVETKKWVFILSFFFFFLNIYHFYENLSQNRKILFKKRKYTCMCIEVCESFCPPTGGQINQETKQEES